MLEYGLGPAGKNSECDWRRSCPDVHTQFRSAVPTPHTLAHLVTHSNHRTVLVLWTQSQRLKLVC